MIYQGRLEVFDLISFILEIFYEHTHNLLYNIYTVAGLATGLTIMLRKNNL